MEYPFLLPTIGTFPLPPYNPPSLPIPIDKSINFKNVLSHILTTVEKDIMDYKNRRYTTPSSDDDDDGHNDKSSTLKPLTKYSHPLIYLADEQVVIIYDGYPKCPEGHLLLLFRKSYVSESGVEFGKINSLSDLSTEDDVIRNIKEFHYKGGVVGRFLSGGGIGEGDLSLLTSSSSASASSSSTTTTRKSYTLGYHAIPSLTPLHLHLLLSPISTPLQRLINSPNTKSMHHIQSFQQPFLILSDEVETHYSTSLLNTRTCRISIRINAAERCLHKPSKSIKDKSCDLFYCKVCNIGFIKTNKGVGLFKGHECDGGVGGGEVVGEDVVGSSCNRLLSWEIGGSSGESFVDNAVDRENGNNKRQKVTVEQFASSSIARFD